MRTMFRLRKNGPAVLVLLICSTIPSFGQTPSTFTDVHHDVSQPLKNLAATALASARTSANKTVMKRAQNLPLLGGAASSGSQQDPVLQTAGGASPAVVSGPTAGLNFEGLGQGFPNFFVESAPSDPVGAVGLTQYVQAVNFNLAVFDKSTGNLLLGPVPETAIWQGFGGACETSDDGEPILLYDKLADRWVFSFTGITVNGSVLGPFFACVAVSTTPDATGTYNRYAFQYSTFNNLGRFGVWPDAYYAAFDMLAAASPFNFLGANACAYDRNAMLAGQPATQICFQQGPTISGLLPADIDGHNPPPAGSPNYMVSLGDNAVNLFKFHADFATPANSTFTGPTAIPVAAFTGLCPGSDCVVQPNTPVQLESAGDRLMPRLAYRNFGDHESLVVNHSVAVGTDAAPGGGLRWYEIQNPNGTPTVAQQSTFAPDSATFRWMGSMAMDQVGDIAMGYNISSASVFPSIGFTARAAGDPANAMGPEVTIVSGGGSQTEDSFGTPLPFWGEANSMQVDPSDDCTFWFTAQYQATTGIFNWNTRIASFTFPGCPRPDLAISSTHTGNFTQGQTGATYTLTATNTSSVDTTGTITVADTLPAGLTATAIAGTGWSCDLPSLTCTRSDVLAAGGGYPAITLTANVAQNAAGIVMNTATISGGGELNTANDTSTDSTTVIQQGPDPAIAISHAGVFVQGQTGTITLAVSNAGLSPLDGSQVAVTDALPSGLTASSISGTGWTCVVGPPVKCTRTDALASNASYPAITLTVNIASNAAASVLNTATVSGGGETNTLNDSASETVAIIPPPADLTITKTHTGNFQQGGFGQYTITVTNSGTGSTQGTVTVTDNAPAGLTVVNMSGIGWFCNPGPTTCSRNDVIAGNGSYPPISVTVNVAGNASPSLTNSAVVSGGGEINTANDTANDPTTITANPDLAITKTHAADFTVGQNGTYTITVSNAGGAPTVGAVSVSDFLPQGMTATAITATGWTCSALPTQFINCSRSDVLASGVSYPAITFTVRVDGASGTSVVNNASVSGGGELNLANNNASDTAAIKGPTLAITKSHAPTVLSVGQTATYTITVSNTGTTATTGSTTNPVTMTDFLPSGMIATDFTGSTGWTCPQQPTSFVTCTRSDVLATGSAYPPIVMTVKINGTFASSIINSASVSGGGDLITHTASDPATINGPSLTINQTHAPATFVVGQTGTYTITIGNNGLTPTTGSATDPVGITDFVPSGMVATDFSASVGWNCSTPPTNFVLCSRTDVLAPGSSYPPIVMTVRVDGGSGIANNEVRVQGGGDLNLHIDDNPTPVTAPVLAITKTHVGNFTVGHTGDYTITVSNTGPVATQGTVTMNDFLPSGMTATAINAPGWTCPTPPAVFVTCTRSDSLAQSGSYPAIVLTVSIDSSISAAVTNQANVSGGGDLSIHFANDATTINVPDLSIALAHSGNFFAGQTGATYTITVTNVGTVNAAGGTISVSDNLPVGLTATAASGGGWSCFPQAQGQFVSCNTPAGILAPGSSLPPIQITANVATDAPASILNSANVGGIGDANFNNNSASDTIQVSRVAVIANSNPAVTVTAGSSATFAFTATLATAPSVGTVTFTATGLPPNSTAVFSPSTVTQTGAVALTINTSGNGHVASLSPGIPPGPAPPMYLALFFSMAGLLVAAASARKHNKTALRWALTASCFCLLLAFSGCGGGGGGSTTPAPTPTPIATPTPPPVTQAGTYPITVTATSSVAGVAPTTTQVVLTVQ